MTHTYSYNQTATSSLVGKWKLNPIGREIAGKLACLKFDTIWKGKNHLLLEFEPQASTHVGFVDWIRITDVVQKNQRVLTSVI